MAKKTIIHVNQHVIKSNRNSGERDPVLTCKTYNSNTYAHTAEILDGNGKVVATIKYRPDNPLACGAHVWIETNNEVRTHVITPDGEELAIPVPEDHGIEFENEKCDAAITGV